MKILFLIGNDPPVGAVSEWSEIKNYKDKGYLSPGKDYFRIFKALEHNSEFEKEILLARKNAGLPEKGISWDDYYYNYYLESLRVYSEQDKSKYKDFFIKVEKEVNRIKKNITLDTFITDQLDNLIIGGFVFPHDIPISYGAYPEEETISGKDYNGVFIHISHEITLNELKTYIDNNWRNIFRLIKYLPPKSKYYISKRDLRIVELKDKENMEWDEIIKTIIKEFVIDDFDGKLNKISVKRAYGRAKKRLNSIANDPHKDK
ncbi:hypothetical protein A3F57_03120 [Candidatus Roizmanbacteria bacterium RIFCSPHIGHO2_12_FULL_36_11]|uniref:Uncharacterized protein n=1 Tax=Candidatus Curtissbacteria bacterium RIFCSPLOWO2_01_FULL_37_9 TaxID=1797724 RepID=A0A1F5GUH3_9BACT|nr:MAG: hypothetical protein A3A48_03615 [Candidatus Curtissbacteria bacterium RIFCSPLOWO2_01_FULL_37_9]OGK32554.1 MAG: hypothetical protein A3F57_03120 [Candidatus Roizmanbacteria bacterium RIFCSPHIGHO2_12_FULL_36_11]